MANVAITIYHTSPCSATTLIAIEPELIDGAVVDAAEYSEALATLASSATLSESCMELVSEALSLSFAEIITLITASSDTHLHYITHCNYSRRRRTRRRTTTNSDYYYFSTTTTSISLLLLVL